MMDQTVLLVDETLDISILIIEPVLMFPRRGSYGFLRDSVYGVREIVPGSTNILGNNSLIHHDLTQIGSELSLHRWVSQFGCIQLFWSLQTPLAAGRSFSALKL